MKKVTWTSCLFSWSRQYNTPSKAVRCFYNIITNYVMPSATSSDLKKMASGELLISQRLFTCNVTTNKKSSTSCKDFSLFYKLFNKKNADFTAFNGDASRGWAIYSKYQYFIDNSTIKLKKSGRFWDLRTYQSWIQTTAFQEIQGHCFRVSKKRENPQEIRPYY